MVLGGNKKRVGEASSFNYYKGEKIFNHYYNYQEADEESQRCRVAAKIHSTLVRIKSPSEKKKLEDGMR